MLLDHNKPTAHNSPALSSVLAGYRQVPKEGHQYCLTSLVMQHRINVQGVV